MYKIMFVCHGNICRSPMAEFMFRDMTQKLGRGAEFEIASSAVSSETVWNGKGSPVYPPAKAMLKSVGISCEGKFSQVLTAADGEKYDLFLCMDDDNVRRALAILGEKYADKCKKLLTYAGENGDVADPWYTRDFNATYQDIKRSLYGLIKQLQ